jgi:GAF domain-containing protein/CheY-like chemotaxis protein
MADETSLAGRRAILLQAAAEVGRAISSILHLDELLAKTVDIICDKFGFYYAGVFLIEEGETGDASSDETKDTPSWAVLRAGRGEAGAAMVAEGYRLEVNGSSMIGAAAGKGTAVIALDVGEAPVHFKNPHLPDTHSEMALPLKVGDRIIGALTVQSTEQAAFSEDDITVLQTMADQLAIAINNAKLHQQNQRLLEQVERRATLLEAAAAVGRDVTSILDLDALLGEVVYIICGTYGFYYAGVFLIDETGQWAVLRAGRGDAGAAMVAERHRLEVGGCSMVGAATGYRKALIALDVGEEPVHFKNPHLPNTRSEMALPLVVGEKLIGAVTVQSTEPAAFSDDDITSLQAMADQLAVAINNALLLKELEAAHEELVRTKTFEAIATSTLEAIHWIGNKALPITASVHLLLEDLERIEAADTERLESMREDLEMIRDSADLIVSVQEHLIGPAREEEPRPAMLDDVVKDAVVAASVPSKMVTYDVAAVLPLGRADTTQLRRALDYVLQNALEAVADAKKQHIVVRVAPAEEKGFVAISIADSGPGIPEEEMDKIWAAFHTTKGAKHAGLGLSAALQIVRQLNGRISAANRPSGGAVFELLIPAYEGPMPDEVLPSGKAVLLMDDNDAWSRFVGSALDKAGNTVAHAADGRVDLAQFDLILLDDVLETADSSTILERLAEAKMAGKTVVVASGLRVEQTMSMLQMGAKDVVLKPYTVGGLAHILG